MNIAKIIFLTVSLALVSACEWGEYPIPKFQQGEEVVFKMSPNVKAMIIQTICNNHRRRKCRYDIRVLSNQGGMIKYVREFELQRKGS